MKVWMSVNILQLFSTVAPSILNKLWVRMNSMYIYNRKISRIQSRKEDSVVNV